jgi:hypothetical protein
MPGTTEQVLAHHAACFDAGDLDGLAADYALDAVLFTLGNTFEGREAIRAWYAGVLPEFSVPGVRFDVRHEAVHGGIAYLVWTATTPRNTYELATDTFVVADGRIVAQTFTAKVVPRPGSSSA